MVEKSLQPTISCILSVYNDELYIDSAIESVINQSFPDWELIIVDDASTDSTPFRLQKYLIHPKIQVITNTCRKGLTYNLNLAIDIARGTYIARLDSDDFCYVNRFQMQFRMIEETSGYCMACASGYDVLDLRSNQITSYKQIKDLDIVRTNLKKGIGCFLHSSMMFRRTSPITGLLNKYDLSYLQGQDQALWIDFLSVSSIVVIEYPLVLARRYSDKSITSKRPIFTDIILKARLVFKANMLLDGSFLIIITTLPKVIISAIKTNFNRMWR